MAEKITEETLLDVFRVVNNNDNISVVGEEIVCSAKQVSIGDKPPMVTQPEE